MKNLKAVEKTEPNDLEVLEKSFDNVLISFNDCFEVAEDDRKTKMNIIGSIFSFGFSLTKLTLTVAGCAIKHTPKAIVTVAAVKREIVTEIESGWNEYKKEQQEEALNEKIKQLTLKR